jgi:hypothetical protein
MIVAVSCAPDSHALYWHTGTIDRCPSSYQGSTSVDSASIHSEQRGGFLVVPNCDSSSNLLWVLLFRLCNAVRGRWP